MPVAGDVIRSLYAPRLLFVARTADNFQTGTTAVTLLSHSVTLRNDTVYRFEAFARTRWVTTADHDGQGQLDIRIDGTSIAVGRGRGESTTTTRAGAIWVGRPAWTPVSTGSVVVTLTGNRTTVTGSTSDVEFRGSGGEESEIWLACYVVGEA